MPRALSDPRDAVDQTVGISKNNVRRIELIADFNRRHYSGATSKSGVVSQAVGEFCERYAAQHAELRALMGELEEEIRNQPKFR